MKSAAIFNSRQSKIILGDDLWVVQSLKAVKFALSEGFSVLTSIEMPTYELLVWAVGRFGGHQIVFVPDYVAPQWVVDQFGLKPELVDFVHIQSQSRTKRKSWWKIRDILVAERADVIFPVSIRHGGFLDSILSGHRQKISKRFEVSYHSVVHKLPKPPDPDDLDDRFKVDATWHYLTHWTSTTYRPWCGEKFYEFYDRIVSSRDRYAHSAFDALQHILRTSVICGSSSKVRASASVVSFTELSPIESVKLMRWSHRKVGFYWEPYGVAIERDVAIEIGVRPVIYGNDETFRSLDRQLRPFFQPSKGKKHDWTLEREWRFVGDFHLRLVPKNKILVITKTQQEKEEIERQFGFKTTALLKS